MTSDASTLNVTDLFTSNHDTEKLNDVFVQIFHAITAKLLLLYKQSRPEI